MADSDKDDAANRWTDHKSALMESSLGQEHNIVSHAVVPYALGGSLDLYYYPHGIPGTAIATKELSEAPNEGPSNGEYNSYELVMFTKLALDLDAVKDKKSPFGLAHANINAVLNAIAVYSTTAKLNLNETCEFPRDMKRVGGKCVIFDGYAKHTDAVAKRFGLLLIIEIFRSEMDFARKNGGAKLIARLKAKGHYPYSDLDREAVA